jgi:hypothetical protein
MSPVRVSLMMCGVHLTSRQLDLHIITADVARVIGVAE